MIQHSPSIVHLMGAMLKVQGAVDGVRTDSKNPAFKSTYASLETVVDTIRPECQKNGLVVMQAPGAYANGVIAVETMIAHAESGEWVRSEISIPVQKQDPQGAGSAITYAERYSLMAIFNLPPVDDDGNDASRHPQMSQRDRPTDAPAPTTVRIAPNGADAAAAKMVEQINMATTVEALESTKALIRPEFLRLPREQQKHVSSAAEAKALMLEPA